MEDMTFYDLFTDNKIKEITNDNNEVIGMISISSTAEKDVSIIIPSDNSDKKQVCQDIELYVANLHKYTIIKQDVAVSARAVSDEKDQPLVKACKLEDGSLVLLPQMSQVIGRL